MKTLTEEERDVIMSIIHDAITLDQNSIDSIFNCYRASIDKERRDNGLLSFEDDDWDFIHRMFSLFYRSGFNAAAQRISDAFKTVSYLTEDRNS